MNLLYEKIYFAHFIITNSFAYFVSDTLIKERLYFEIISR